MTLSQLGISKWEARKMFALAAVPQAELEARMADFVAHARGRSITALVEKNGRRGRRRNPLIRAWRSASQSERAEFLDVIFRLRFLVERAADVESAGEEEERTGTR